MPALRAAIGKLTAAEKRRILADRSPDGWAYSTQFAEWLTEDEVKKALPDPSTPGVTAFLTRFRAAVRAVPGPVDGIPFCPPLAPTPDDLAEAQRIAERHERSPRRRAQAVVARRHGITVFCTAGAGQDEHTMLLTLAHDGTVRGERRYTPRQGVGRAIAPLLGGGFAVAGRPAVSSTRTRRT